MIKIICIGKIKEKYLKDAIADYQKRISKYTNMNIIEIEEENSDDIKKNLIKEEEKLYKYINDNEYIIALDIKGEMLNSIELAQKIDQLFSIGKSNITFIIGSSYGLSNDLIDKADLKLSFSRLTFPHQLFRLILVEQLYRAFKINNNETYHK